MDDYLKNLWDAVQLQERLPLGNKLKSPSDIPQTPVDRTNRFFNFQFPARILAAILILSPLSRIAADEDPVQRAYLGSLTSAKSNAALQGFNELLTQASIYHPGSGSFSINFRTTPGFLGFGLLPLPFDPGTFNFTIIEATDDADLGAPGQSLILNRSGILAQAGFTSNRNILLGRNGAFIDTNGFDLTFTGDLQAGWGTPPAPSDPLPTNPLFVDISDWRNSAYPDGFLIKRGPGALTLNGDNQWDDTPLFVESGTVRGNAASLGTTIDNSARVEFFQETDAGFTNTIKGGELIKSGNGTLTLLSPDNRLSELRINDGTLSLGTEAAIGNPSVAIAEEATFDLTANQAPHHVQGIAGNGHLTLGAHPLVIQFGENEDNGSTSNGYYDFSGVISGSGGLVIDGSGVQMLRGHNSYSGLTQIVEGTLSLADEGSLYPNGGVEIRAQGRLDISEADGDRTIGSLNGRGRVLLGDNTLSVGKNDTDTVFGGEIQGNGGLTKTGAGTLELIGTNSFTGATRINEGILRTRTTAISETVHNQATLIFDQHREQYPQSASPGIEGPSPVYFEIATYSGEISGSGQTIKEGSGLLWLRGNNSYTGGTQVLDGALMGNTDSLQGNITNQSQLAFYQVEDGTYPDTISGSGKLYLFGPGALTLSGDNTHTGTTIVGSLLNVVHDSALGAVPAISASPAEYTPILVGGFLKPDLLMAGGTLRITDDLSTARHIGLAPAGGSFDTNGHDLVVTGVVDGNGGLRKLNPGTLTLAGNNTYTGPTHVEAGRLTVDGRIGEAVYVSRGAEIGGSGLIEGNLTNSGRFYRGPDTGDFRVRGNVIFTPGSIFAVNADAEGNADRLVLESPGATAEIQGGSVEVIAEQGNYRRDTDYTLLTAPGGVKGRFEQVATDLAFLTPALSYDDTSLYLRLSRNDLDYNAVARSPDQRAAAGAVSGLTRLDGDAAVVTAAIDGMNPDQARDAFQDIAAPLRTALVQLGQRTQRVFSQAATTRLGLLESGSRLAPATGLAGKGLRLGFEHTSMESGTPLLPLNPAALGGETVGTEKVFGDGLRHGFWVRGYGGTGRVDDDGEDEGYSYDFGGVLGGYDWRVNQSLTLGLQAGYARPRFEQDQDRTKVRDRQIGAYGRYRQGALHVDAVLSGARQSYDSRRNLELGTLQRTAEASFDGDSLSAYLEAGYLFEGNPLVEPLAALHWSRQHQDSYSEKGAGALNLSVPENTQHFLRGILGVRTTLPVTTAAGTRLALESRAAWSHDFRDSGAVSARFAADPGGAPFAISGVSLPRDSAHLGIGIAGETRKNLRFYADLDTELNSRQQSIVISAGIRYRW
ncbi:MAG: autotransporter domain-containing protein [Gammaproteobacteria bacterium]|nr:autotransporter domain-containing protein [Gammaproteobacteria bacterium]